MQSQRDKCLNLIWNLYNWVGGQQQRLLLVYKAVTGQFPAILAEDISLPVRNKSQNIVAQFAKKQLALLL